MAQDSRGFGLWMVSPIALCHGRAEHHGRKRGAGAGKASWCWWPES